MQIQCEDINSLLNKLNIESSIFVGVSYGGVISQFFAYLYPDKVKKLIVVDSFCDTRPKSAKMFGVMIGAYMTWAYYLPKKHLVSSIRKTYNRWPLTLKEMEDLVVNNEKKRSCQTKTGN